MTPVTPVAVFTDTEDTELEYAMNLVQAAGFTTRFLNTRDPEAIIAGAQDAMVLLPGFSPITRHIIESLPNLKLISLMSMGIDYIDVDAATEHGVWVSNVPAAATEEVATHALALLLYVVRQLDYYTKAANPTDWNSRPTPAPWRLSERTLGVLGLGHIGLEFARVAGPQFGRILGYDPLLPDTDETRAKLTELRIERTTLEQVRGEADVLSLTLPLRPETEGMVNAEFLAAMPAGSVILNVGRGPIIDEAALVAALDSGHISGAALDVLATEPPQPEHPLLGRRNVIVTPHVGYLSERTLVEYPRVQAQNAITFLRTGRPDTPINQPQI